MGRNDGGDQRLGIAENPFGRVGMMMTHYRGSGGCRRLTGDDWMIDVLVRA